MMTYQRNVTHKKKTPFIYRSVSSFITRVEISILTFQHFHIFLILNSYSHTHSSISCPHSSDNGTSCSSKTNELELHILFDEVVFDQNIELLVRSGSSTDGPFSDYYPVPSRTDALLPYFLTSWSQIIDSSTTRVMVGNIRSGVAAPDHYSGPGFIMYSSESVFTRFSTNPVHTHQNTYMVAVRYENGKWEYVLEQSIKSPSIRVVKKLISTSLVVSLYSHHIFLSLSLCCVSRNPHRSLRQLL